MTYAIQSMISRDSYYSRYLTGVKPISIFLGVMGNSQKKNRFYPQGFSNKNCPVWSKD